MFSVKKDGNNLLISTISSNVSTNGDDATVTITPEQLHDTLTTAKTEQAKYKALYEKFTREVEFLSGVSQAYSLVEME